MVRSAMAQIAQDETRHAELALALDAWLSTTLDRAERWQVATARRSAYEALRRELRSTESAADPIPGLPSGAQSKHLLDEAMGVVGM
jgi:hypothetical protein